MDQVKKGPKTFFQASSTEICKSNKELDSPTPGPSTNNPSYAKSFSEIGESHYLCSDEKSSDCPASKWLVRPKWNKEKMKFNPQWL